MIALAAVPALAIVAAIGIGAQIGGLLGLALVTVGFAGVMALSLRWVRVGVER